MRHFVARWCWTLAVVGILVMASAPAYGQGGTSTATLTGLVVDASGGVLPGVDIVAKNNATGDSYPAVSDGEGRFTIPALQPGTYTVTFALAGFKTVVYPDIRLVTSTAGSAVKAVLELGKIEESIVVTGQTEIVQTQSATVTTILPTEQVRRMPMPTRNTLDFVTQLPGVNTTTSLRNSSVMGLLPGAINITIDGVNVQDNALRSTSSSSFFASINPRLDAVEEVAVSMANEGADSSGSGAVQVRFTTRSGSNRFSGSGYWYLRRTQWNTNFWFNEHSTFLPRDMTRVDTFGFRVGGPIMKDKLFYFFNFEEFRQPFSQARTRTVLTDAAINGDWTCAACQGSVNLLQLAASKGQVSTYDPAMLQMLKDIKATYSNGTLTPGSTPIVQSFSFQNAGIGTRYYPTTRIDYNVTSSHRVGVSWYQQRYTSYPDILNNRDPAYPGYKGAGDQVSWRPSVMANWRSTWGKNLVNELRGGWRSGTVHFFDNVTADDFPGGWRTGVPLISAPYTVSNMELRGGPLWSLEDTLSWLKGSHSIQLGGSFSMTNYQDYFKYLVPSISIGFNSTYDPAQQAMFNDPANFPAGATASDRNQAASLYALLTGRVSAINNSAYLNPTTGKYEYNGPWEYYARQNQYGLFAQDSWRLRPDLTITGGLRWQVQMPFTSQNLFFAKLQSFNMLYGVSGVDSNGNPNLFKPGTMTGSSDVKLVQLEKGKAPYNTDWNNIAPNVGVAWRPPVKGGFLKMLLSSDPVFRAGYSRSYTVEGLVNSADIYGANEGGSVVANRNTALNNLVYPGEQWPILFRDSARLGPPTFPDAPAYPFQASVTSSINEFNPHTQVPWQHSFNLSFQRTLSKNMAVDLRYVGTRSRGGWIDGGRNINELNWVENGYLAEFKMAQANLYANLAAGKGATFAYTGAPGTSPLPIMLSSWQAGIQPGDASNPAMYKSSNFTNSTSIGYLSKNGATISTSPSTSSTSTYNSSALFTLATDAVYKQNLVNAQYPRNFWFLNPDVWSVWVTGRPEDALQANFDAVQIDLRRRFADGLLAAVNYQYVIRSESSSNPSLHRGRDWSRNADAIHAFKINWTYELPFGQGKPFWGGVSSGWNRLVGGWTIDGSGRIQTGNTLDYGAVTLVNMTDKDLQDMYKLRFEPDKTNPKVTRVYMLPADVVEQTKKAYTYNYQGYTAGEPTGKYIKPMNTDGCISLYTGFCTDKSYHHYVTGPGFVRFDLALSKRIDLTKRVYSEIRFEALNAFDNVNFRGNTGVGQNYSDFYLSNTSAYRDTSNTQDPGGRIIQIAFRVNW